jgi:SPP1 gp7 family putative phage head morphogenesis protein
MPDFNDAFAWDQPFAEAVDFFLAKGIMTRAEFDKLAAAEKVKAFTAAYVHAADDLQVVYEAVLSALEKGTPLRDFVKATEDILTRPWHRETVFRTNVLSSYGAGHWEQAQDTRSMRPFARYSAVMDGRTRPRHAVLHGLVYPLDHPFWQTYWPPWDYNCRCAAITLSQGEIDREGLKVSQGMPPEDGRRGRLPHNNFVSPAAGGEWKPDYGKYAPELGMQVRQRIERAIYD